MENGLKDRYTVEFDCNELLLLILCVGTVSRPGEAELYQLSKDITGKKAQELYVTGRLSRLLATTEGYDKMLLKLLQATEGRLNASEAIEGCKTNLGSIEKWKRHLQVLDKQKGYSVHDN